MAEIANGPRPASPESKSTINLNATRLCQQQTKPRTCDHCRRRRIRCDYNQPCQQCISATLVCKRDHVPRKRGPKRGHGRVIDELRAQEVDDQRSRESSPEYEETQDVPGQRSAATTNPSSPEGAAEQPWHDELPSSRTSNKRKRLSRPDVVQPRSRPHFDIVSRCMDLYYEHIYPTMPLLYMPEIRSMVNRELEPSEKSLIYALCAMVCMHMSASSLHVEAPSPSWESAGRFFLDECVSNRQSYDFMEDLSLNAVLSSFWLSTSYFELGQNRKSWLYLREALTLAQDLGIQHNSTYVGLSSQKALCRQRVYWILFVTERSFAILRNKPITLKKMPSLPTRGHAYESPDIHVGFLQLVSAYTPLDASFVCAWNSGADQCVDASTYIALQTVLAQPPSFVSRGLSLFGNQTFAAGQTPRMLAVEPTDIQKADLLITQQWLRLIVWQSSFRQGLLSWTAPSESMQFGFPLAIARQTASILHSLPSSAIEVHGMGMFEKIFEIGQWNVNAMGAADSASLNSLSTLHHPSGSCEPGTLSGMDFLPGRGDLGLFSSGRRGYHIDPLEFFVKTLSSSPNSRKQFADRLRSLAQSRAGAQRMALTPALGSPVLAPVDAWPNNGSGMIIEDVNDDLEEHTDYAVQVSSRGVLDNVDDTTLDLDAFSVPLLPMSTNTSVPIVDWNADDSGFLISPSLEGHVADMSDGHMMSVLPRPNSGTDSPLEMPFGTGISPSEQAILLSIQEREQKSNSYQDLGVW